MQTIWELFERAVECFRDRTAIIEGSERSTYEDFDRRVRSFAAGLTARGIAAGDRVAILEENSADYLAAYFAAAGVGAVLVPLNTRLAARELTAVLADARASLLLHGPACTQMAASLPSTPSLVLVRGSGADAVDPDLFRPVSRVPEDLAQLYYTSGTTGQPKGVMLTHRNITAHAASAVTELRITAEDRWGHFAPLFHLADAWATFAITSVGATHVMSPRFDPASALALLSSAGITLTNLVPTMLSALVGVLGSRPATEAVAANSLRLLLSGGAPITKTLVRRVLELFRCEYAQTYGMTESSPYLTLGLLHEHLAALPDEQVLAYRARTGRAFLGVTLEVVDDASLPVPADDATVGEIRVRGATISPGYWERPEETAAAFRGGWLYTGDLAVIDREGYVNIVDRRQDMIVTGGENVYSIEVENALAEHPEVLDVAAFGVPDERWGESIRAAVVRMPGSELDEQELVRFCRERIARYKVPGRIYFPATLPKTGSGKVSKAELRAGADHE